jgi:hypothetical protein
VIAALMVAVPLGSLGYFRGRVLLIIELVVKLLSFEVTSDSPATVDEVEVVSAVADDKLLVEAVAAARVVKTAELAL